MPIPAPPRLTGIFPIAPTPFTDGGELDLDGQRRVIDSVLAEGGERVGTDASPVQAERAQLSH